VPASSREQVRLALVSNRVYLAKFTAGTLTDAERDTQLARLTRQVQALIRLLVVSDVLDDVEET